MNIQSLIHRLQQETIPHYCNTSISSYLTMGIGGTVPLIIEAHTTEIIILVLTELHRMKTQFVLLGGGSNLIFPDHISNPDLTVIINRSHAIRKEKEGFLKVDSGVSNSRLMNWNIQHHIGGMDFMAGIPGTIGGAAAVNAGAFGQSISQILSAADIIDHQGNHLSVDADYFQFQYRNSRFKYGKEVILDVTLKYTPESGDEVKEKVTGRIDYRRKNHPDFNLKSAGCFFKNPIIQGEKISAGRLLEQTGFKGSSFDRLSIAPEHANFVINNGNAVFSDIQQLESNIQGKVHREKGIQLEREVIYISPEGEKY